MFEVARETNEVMMKLGAQGRRAAAKRAAQGLVAATLACGLLGCSVPVQEAAAHTAARDGGPADAQIVEAGPRASAHADNAKPEPYGSEFVGLTYKQLEKRRGPPTEKKGSRWIYAPPQPGCSDRIMSEVFTFKNGRVVKLTRKRRQTGAGPQGCGECSRNVSVES